MSNKKIVNFIGHTHWDREWYFTINDASLLSTWNFERVVEVLENNKDYPSFCLDGQTSIIEDAVELKPELKERISKLVKEKRIFLGPWHTQTDSFYVDGESFIRNLYFGSMFAEEIGHSMQLGYLPDTFGHNIQTPQFYKGFGLDNALFWRGREKKKITDTYFTWKGLDGSEVFTLNLLQGYSLASGIKNDSNEWDNKIIPLMDKLANDTKYKNIIMPSGGDQVIIDENLPETVSALGKYVGEDYEVKISDYETLVKDLREEIGDLKELQVWNDELRFPEVARVHRTIGSSRYDIKKKSFELEHKLVNVLEPLSIIIKETVDKKLINNEVKKISWKLLLDGHAHDSLGACNTDITNENVLNRFKRAENLIDGMINLFEKTIGVNVNKKHSKNLVLYNFESKSINDYREVVLFSSTKGVKVMDGETEVPFAITNIERIGAEGAREVILTPKGDIERDIPPYYQITGLVKTKLPSFGYKSFNVIETEDRNVDSVNGNNVIENDKVKLTIENDKVTVLNKDTNTLYEQLIRLENVANDGDSYDFSPMRGDTPILDWSISNIGSIKLENNISKLEFEAKVNIPFELIDRKERSKEVVTQVFKFELLLIDSKIRFNIKTTNIAKDHRFRIKFDSKLSGESKIFTDVPFGYLERGFVPVPENWKDYMVEKPVNYYPIINTFFTKNENETISINTKGIKEIEIKENKDIYLTLYKADGWLGKNDLELRPNRASGINNVLVPTPDAQLFHKDLEFEFEINFLNKDIDQQGINEVRTNYISKFDYYQDQNLDAFKDRLERFQLNINEYELDESISLFEETKLTLVASYISHKDDANILRFVNYKDEAIDPNSILVDKQPTQVNFAEKEVQHEPIVKYRLATYKI